MTKRASIEATVKRGAGWSGDPCEGHVMYDVGERGFPTSFSPENILGRVLGDGTRVRVTVTVLEEKPVPDRCIVGHHDRFASRHRSSVVTVGLDWREREAEREAEHTAREEERKLNASMNRAARELAKRQGARA